MRRRDFITLIAGATAWPLAARAQQSAMPVVGLITEAADAPPLTTSFRQGLAEAGYVESKNVAIEYHFLNFRRDLLPQAAGDLVPSNVSLIFATTPEAVAVIRNATTSIPIVA